MDCMDRMDDMDAPSNPLGESLAIITRNATIEEKGKSMGHFVTVRP